MTGIQLIPRQNLAYYLISFLVVIPAFIWVIRITFFNEPDASLLEEFFRGATIFVGLLFFDWIAKQLYGKPKQKSKKTTPKSKKK